MRKSFLTRYAAAALIFFLLLPACELRAPGESKPTPPPPEALFTIAAQTAEAMRIQRFAQTPSLAPQQLIETVADPTETPTPTVASTPAAIATDPGRSAPPPAGADRGEFVADVNIPDGTVFAPGEAFQKTWRISNTGQTTWTIEYELVFIDGDLLGAAASVPLPEEVAPGEQVDITVDMIAPSAAGTYTSYWKMKNDAGQTFGFGSAGTEAIWTKIVVQTGLALETTATATLGAAQPVGEVSLSVDSADVSGACPHTFLLTAQLTLDKPATVTYNLEVGDASGATLKTWTPITQNLVAGVHPVIYELTLAESTSGWARLRLTQPAELISNQVNFTLVCG